jgi:hypothetical protein
MIKIPIKLQDLKREIYIKGKSEKETLVGTGGVEED